jgi:hypothetical protein
MKKTPDNVALAKQQRANGWTLLDIADHFQIHENTAGMWVNEGRAEKHRQRRRSDYRDAPALTPESAKALIAQLAGQPVRTLIGREPGVICTGEWAGGYMLHTSHGPRPFEAIVLKRGLQRRRIKDAIATLH